MMCMGTFLSGVRIGMAAILPPQSLIPKVPRAVPRRFSGAVPGIKPASSAVPRDVIALILQPGFQMWVSDSCWRISNEKSRVPLLPESGCHKRRATNLLVFFGSLYLDMQLPQLPGRNGRRRLGHQACALGGLGKRNHVANARRAA